MPASAELKQAILETLQELFSGNEQESIFCDPPTSSVIFVNADRSNDGCFLHGWDKENKRHIPYPSCMKGKITKLEVVKLEGTEGETFKLRTTVKNSSQTVVIQSGVQSMFSRDILFVVSMMTVDALKETIFLEAYIPDLTKFTQISEGKKKKILSCRLYDSFGSYIYFEKPKESDTDYRAIAEKAIENVRIANGESTDN